MSKQSEHFPSLDARFTDFEDFKEIGSGQNCVICRAMWTSLSNPKNVVVKLYDQSRLTTSKIRAIKKEAQTMEVLQQERIPYVVEYLGSFMDRRRLCLVMEFCEKGDLFDNFDGRAMNERRVANHIARPLLISLTALHKNAFIHRDIKLENIFVDGSDCVKFGDFGLTINTGEELGVQQVGTVMYMAPEIFALATPPPCGMKQQKAIDEKVDIWALGVTFYGVLTGMVPFGGSDHHQIKQSIVKNQLMNWHEILSTDCKDFLLRMLKFRPEDRPSAQELLKHSWIQRHHRSQNTFSGLQSTEAAASGNQICKSLSLTEADTTSVVCSKYIIRLCVEVQRQGKGMSATKTRRATGNSPAPPLISPSAIALITDCKKNKIKDRLARLLPTYKSRHELDVCMRGKWELEISSDEDDIDM